MATPDQRSTLTLVGTQDDRRVGRSVPSWVNARLTAEQFEWLEVRADAEHGGNVSAALREAVGLARLLDLARLDYRDRDGVDVDDDGATALWRVVLALDVVELPDVDEA